jgi:hypothetical protein
MKTRRILLPAALAGTCLLSLGACALSLASLFVLLSKHPAPPQIVPLQWSQIESSDADRYAENLHAVGCPAPTIQAILGQTASGDSSAAPAATAQVPAPAAPTVTAAAASAPAPASPISPQTQTFAERRAAALAAQAQRQSEAQSYAAASNPAPSDAKPVQAAPERSANATYSGESVPASYAQEGDSGSASPGGYASAGTSNAGPIQTIVAPDANSQIPAAFAETPPSSNPTAAQAHQLDGIQQQFASAVSGSNSGADATSANAIPSGNGGTAESSTPTTASNSPTSTTPANPKKAWQTATWLADQQYRAQFGTQAFLQHQEQANHTSSSQ